jgi:hypothetical protein
MVTFLLATVLAILIFLAGTGPDGIAQGTVREIWTRRTERLESSRIESK